MRKPSTTALCRTVKLQDRQLTIGLDLGDRSSFYCVLNGAGEVILASLRSLRAGVCGTEFAGQTGITPTTKSLRDPRRNISYPSGSFTFVL